MMKEITIKLTPEYQRQLKSDVWSKKVTSNLHIDYSVSDRLTATILLALQEGRTEITPKLKGE